MAYAALVSLAQLLDQILHHDSSFYIPTSSDERQKLASLLEKASFLQAFMDNYSDKCGERIQFLEARIRDAAYQAQDIIEWHSSDYGVNRGFRKLFSAIRKVTRRRIRNKYGKNLLTSLEQMDSIVEEAMNIQRSFTSVEQGQVSEASSRTAPNRGNKTVGLEEDLIEIKGRLCGESSKLDIIPIVGMGGIGKTTLAKNIFDDSLVAYHFDVRAWITISQEYNFREVLLGLLDPSEELSKTTNEELVVHVYKSLKGRRYIIVVDDMWSQGAWDDLKWIFPEDENGSRIMMTTRLQDVAEYVSSSPIHQMHLLSVDNCWDLLHGTVFVEQSCPKELEAIGRMIAENCHGLPLAVAVIAGILIKIDRSPNHWMNIAKNISSAISTTNDHFSEILSLSYRLLPNHLKACFLYMGGFPEDYEIPVSELILLWVAEGFLKPIVSKSLEVAAEEYLEDLVKRNLVLIIKKRSNGKFKSCGVHDLLRDLCIRKAREEKFLDAYTRSMDVANHRRLTIHSGIYNATSKITNTCALHIRTVLHYGRDWRINLFVLLLRLLRVLDMPNLQYEYPELTGITELCHLRYLSISYPNDCERPIMLPQAICKLHNLQTLIIYSFSYSTSYHPFVIWKVPQSLRHLILRGSRFHVHLAPNIGGLQNLHTLCGVKNFRFTRKVIDMIPNLKKLKVCCTYTKFAKLCLNDLVHLHQLETLNLEFINDISPSNIDFSPSNYALPPNLNKLTLKGFRPPSNDMAIIGSLPNLEVLKLRVIEFGEGDWESKEDGFPRLKFLLIEESNLASWRVESSHFPCLQHVIIRYCFDLEEIPLEIGDVTTLELIEVCSGSKSASDSAVLIEEEQRSLGNDTLQVRISK